MLSSFCLRITKGIARQPIVRSQIRKIAGDSIKGNAQIKGNTSIGTISNFGSKVKSFITNNVTIDINPAEIFIDVTKFAVIFGACVGGVTGLVYDILEKSSIDVKIKNSDRNLSDSFTRQLIRFMSSPIISHCETNTNIGATVGIIAGLLWPVILISAVCSKIGSLFSDDDSDGISSCSGMSET